MSIYMSSVLYSQACRADLALGLAAYIDLGAGITTIEYHEVGGAAQGLLATFELSAPAYTTLDGILTLRVSPVVKAVVAPGITAAEPDYFYLKNAEGNVVGEGTLVRTASEQVDTGDILSFTSMSINLAIDTPQEVVGLKAWFSDQVTGAGTAGFQVTDLSGNGNHGTQATTADQPVSGSGVLTFTPNDHYDVVSGPLQVSGATTAAFVFRLSGTADVPPGRRKLLTDNAEGAIRWFLETDGNMYLDFPGSGNRLIVPAASVDWSSELAFTVLFQGGTVTARANGTVVASGSVGLSAMPTFTVPLVIGALNTHWSGAMRNVFIITGRIPSEPELQLLENYGV